jgi:hypothetical protein
MDHPNERQNTMKRPANIALAAALAASLVALPATALAKGGGSDGDVRVAGSCTASSAAKMKLSPENGRLEVEFEVDQNRNGVSWNWTLKRAGSTLSAGTAVTVAPSGSFEVRRVVSNAPGTDTIVAVGKGNGETCRVIASI